METTKLSNQVEEIINFGDTSDSKEYIRIMRESYIPAFEKLNSCITLYIDYLKAIPDLYDALDEAYNNKIEF